MGPSIRANLHHAAQLGDHIQSLLLAQVLGTHDGLLVQQIAGAGLLLQVTLDDVYGPIHVLAPTATSPPVIVVYLLSDVVVVVGLAVAVLGDPLLVPERAAEADEGPHLVRVGHQDAFPSWPG